MKRIQLPGGSFARIADAATPQPGLADTIVDQSVRSGYRRLVHILRTLHRDVRVEEGDVELRATFDQCLLCRIVPYRELIHIQVGASPTWEVRVRDRRAWLDATDRVLREFCRLAASRGRPPGAAEVARDPA